MGTYSPLWSVWQMGTHSPLTSGVCDRWGLTPHLPVECVTDGDLLPTYQWSVWQMGTYFPLTSGVCDRWRFTSGVCGRWGLTPHLPVECVTDGDLLPTVECVADGDSLPTYQWSV